MKKMKIIGGSASETTTSNGQQLINNPHKKLIGQKQYLEAEIKGVKSEAAETIPVIRSWANGISGEFF